MANVSVICAVMIHVSDWRAGLAWYRQAFPVATLVEPAGDGWGGLVVEGVQIEIVPADEKVSSGAAGSVVYWYADDFEARSAYLESIGAILYRGPMQIENGWMMCQFRDPFGNLLGVRGPEK